MFDRLDTAAVTAFAAHVQNSFPGGRHLAARVADGPYQILVVESRESPNWLIETALDAFPSRTITHLNTVDGLSRPRAHLLSAFAAELAYYWQTDEDLLFSELTATLPEDPYGPQAQQVYCDFVCESLFWDAEHQDPDLVAAAIAAVGGPGQLFDTLEHSLARFGREVQPEDIAVTLRALAATAA